LANGLHCDRQWVRREHVKKKDVEEQSKDRRRKVRSRGILGDKRSFDQI